MKKLTPFLSILFLSLAGLAHAETTDEDAPTDASAAFEDAAAIAPRQCFHQSGVASYYSEPQHVACGGGRFNPSALTAAHRTLPCGTRVKVTNPRNGRSVVVTINDRGPYARGRVIDLSTAAFRQIANPGQGLSAVQLEVCR